MNENSKYLINAAEHSIYNAMHWMRYLRKFITENKIKLTPSDIEKVLNSKKLTMFQTVCFKQAIKKESPTSKFIISLNKPNGTPMLNAIKTKAERML